MVDKISTRRPREYTPYDPCPVLPQGYRRAGARWYETWTPGGLLASWVRPGPEIALSRGPAFILCPRRDHASSLVSHPNCPGRAYWLSAETKYGFRARGGCVGSELF